MADWKKQVTYNYNPSYYAYGLVYQPEQNPGNPIVWSENRVTDLSSYNPGTTQTYYAANTPIKTEDESPPGSPKPYPDNGQCFQGSGLVYVRNTQTGHLLVTGPYRSAAYEVGGNHTSQARRDSASDSEAHTSPDSWSSGSSREVGFSQTDPETWAEKYVEDQLITRSPGGSGEVSSSHVEESQTFPTTESGSNIPTALNVPQTDSKSPSTTGVSGPKVKSRIAFSESQMNALVQRFSVQRYLTPNEMKSLAEKTGLTYKQVKTWFQNRRMKLRRHQKDNSWVSERYTLNKDSSVHGPTFSSMPPPSSGERHSQLRKHYNQHMMKAPQNLAYYLAAVGNAAGSAGYPPWSSNSLQAAVPHVSGWSMAPGSSHFEYNLNAFNSNNFVHNTSMESKDGEPVNSQSSLNAAVLPNTSQ